MLCRKLDLPSLAIATSLLLISIDGSTQTYLGITADFGNPISYTSATGEAYFKRSISVSGSINLIKQEPMRNEWFFRYGMAAGVLGYNVKVLLKDTLNQTGSYPPDAFFDYTNLYVSVPWAIGKKFMIKEKNVIIFFGGGASYYINLFPGGVSGSVAVENNNSFESLFDYNIVPANNTLFAFAELSCQVELSQRISIGILYRQHFKAALEGTYNFYHVDNPSKWHIVCYAKSSEYSIYGKSGKTNS
ncbi:MAG TPA: hypothetical protein VFU05_00040 [Cyclobacteriaceae bacterium]|nr:hypothetical protein [Cyclobacteriaceae bacterium]